MAAEAVEIGRQHNAKRLLWKISEDPSATALGAQPMLVAQGPMSASTHNRLYGLQLAATTTQGWLSTHCHHQRSRCVNLLFRSGLRRVQVAAWVQLANNVADAPGKHRIAIVA
jgi:hypothetical protein